MAKKDKRFVLAHQESLNLQTHMQIIVDRETGVQYLHSFKGGVTPLLDRDGKLLLARPEDMA